MKEYTQEQRAEALAKEIGESVEHIGGKNYESESGAEYLILTDAEADELAREEIGRSLWAFNAEFILEHTNGAESLSSFEFLSAVEEIKQAQARACEDLNGLIRCMIGNLEQFASDAINADGRGHFLASYDSEELELARGELFASRVN